MNPWEAAGQMMGVVMGQAQQQTYPTYPYSSGNYLPMGIGNVTTTDNTTLHIGDIPTDVVEEKAEEPPDEFTQLSNHKFHELLDRFHELT